MRDARLQPRAGAPEVRFLPTGMMGGSWAEHVALEMAAGRGVRAAWRSTRSSTRSITSPVVDILRRAVKQEERHVEFGEQQTMRSDRGQAVAAPPPARAAPGLAVGRRAGSRRFMQKRLPADHPVLRHLPAFLTHTNRCAELRMRRMGAARSPAGRDPRRGARSLIAEAYAGKLPGALVSLVTLPFRLLAAPFRKRKRADRHLPRRSVREGLHGGAPRRRGRCRRRRARRLIGLTARRRRGGRARAR